LYEGAGEQVQTRPVSEGLGASLLFWRADLKANRVLLLEPSQSERYPVSTRSIDLTLNLAENIERIQVFVGEFAELRSQPATGTIYFKEHPTATHYEGVREERDWMCPELRGFIHPFSAIGKSARWLSNEEHKAL
jgi:deoxyribodipyrimidine photo-lyase